MCIIQHPYTTYDDYSSLSELPEYAALEAEYGEIPFKIETENYYPSEFQRINGDPHGQAAEREKPDDLGDETLSFDFPNDDDNSYNVLLWSHEATGKAHINIGF